MTLVLRARAFVNSVEVETPAASTEAFYHSDIEQQEYPNLLQLMKLGTVDWLVMRPELMAP